MSLALHYYMGDAHHCSGPPVSEMTYTASSGMLNSTLPYHTLYHTTCPEWCCILLKWYTTQRQNTNSIHVDILTEDPVYVSMTNEHTVKSNVNCNFLQHFDWKFEHIKTVKFWKCVNNYVTALWGNHPAVPCVLNVITLHASSVL